MANPTTADVIAAKPALVGGVASAPLGTTLPTDATSPLGAEFTSHGYITEEGLVPATERETDEKKAWGGDTIKVFQTSYSRTYEFTFAQAKTVDVLKEVFGDDNVEVIPATTEHGNITKYSDKGEQARHKVWVFTAFDGDTDLREVVEDGQITAIEEGPWVDSDIRYYKATMTCFRGTETQDFVTGYIDDGELAEG